MTSISGRMFGLSVQATRESPAGGWTEAPTPDVVVDFVPAPPAAERGDLYFESCKRCVQPIDALRVRRLAEGGYQFWFGDGTWAHIDSSATRVEISTPAESTVEDSVVYLTGPILGFVLRLRGRLALHASAVLIDGAVVAFVGTSGLGKSTIAAAFAQQHAVVLTEDLLALEPSTGSDQVLAHAGCDYVRLWPDSAALLNESGLEPFTRTWDKLRFPLSSSRLEHAPLGLVYLLDPRGLRTADASSVQLSVAQALMALVPETYLSLLLPTTERVRELTALSDLVRRIPVRRLSPPRLPHGLPSLRDVIAADLHSPPLAPG